MKIIVIVILAIFLSSCAVGPDFKRPDAPQTNRYTQEPLAKNTHSAPVHGGETQYFISNMDIPAKWWKVFRSKSLNNLIERSLQANPDIKAAQAALQLAKENVAAQQGAFFPFIAANYNYNPSRTSQTLSPVGATNSPYLSLQTAQLEISYVPDVFGLNRRTVESLEAEVEQQRFQLEATYLTLSANVVNAAIQEALTRALIASTEKQIKINQELLKISRSQLANGFTSRLDVAAQEALLAQLAATLPPLQLQLAQQRHLLTALSGNFPADEPSEQFQLSSLQLPSQLPLSLPSKLVEQRPDVRQAEENMHAASALIGVARANRFPNITISANDGGASSNFNTLLTNANQMWSLTAGVTQPIFAGGALMHKERAAWQAYEQSVQQYRSTVLSAFRNVADTLRAIQQDSNALKANVAAEQAAKVSLDIVGRQLQLGYVNVATLLTAEQTYQVAVMNRLQSQANRFTDTAALFQALGGGWWNR